MSDNIFEQEDVEETEGEEVEVNGVEDEGEDVEVEEKPTVLKDVIEDIQTGPDAGLYPGLTATWARMQIRKGTIRGFALSENNRWIVTDAELAAESLKMAYTNKAKAKPAVSDIPASKQMKLSASTPDDDDLWAEDEEETEDGDESN